MGSVRHRQLVQLLAIFVALDVAVGVVALSARRGDRHSAGTALVAGSVSIPLNDGSGTGVLAGAKLKKRRASTAASVARGSLEAAPATGSAAPPAPASPAPSMPGSAIAGRSAPSAATGAGPMPGAPAADPARGATAASGTASGPSGATTRSSGSASSGAPGGTTRSSASASSGDSGGTAGTSGRTATTRSGPAGSAPATRSGQHGGLRETAPSQPSAPADDTTATSPPDGATTTSRPAATPTTARRPAAGPPRSEVTVTDAAGDTFVDGTQQAMNEPRADIVKAGAAYRSGLLAFLMQVEQPVDPRTDERWASDGTFALWSVDTNGDGQPDFDIQYYGGGGQLGGSVSKSNSADVVCDIEAAYGPEGYSAIVDPACLGNPASVTFRLTMYYDTNPKDDNADVASDVTPNGGMSMPVSRPG